MGEHVDIVSPGGRLSNQFSGSPTSQNPRELYEFEFQIEGVNVSSNVQYQDLDVNYKIQSGQLPLDVTINETSGLISGTVIELDEWVPEFNPPEEYVIEKDGSNYASFGSAAAGSYSTSFVVRAYLVGFEQETFEDQSCSILVVNNYSSDRDQFIRDYSEEYGNTFIVNNEVEDANTYLQYQKSIGNFPPLSNPGGYS